MTQQPREEQTQVEESRPREPVRSAVVLNVQPPPYEQEYLYVPEIMARKEPSSVPIKAERRTPREPDMSAIEQAKHPPGSDLTPRTPQPTGPQKKRREKTDAVDFKVPEHVKETHRKAGEEKDLHTVRQAVELHVEPPPYELEYVYVPEFRVREEPTGVPVKVKEPVALEALAMAEKQQRPSDEVEFPFVPGEIHSKHLVEALHREKTQPSEVSKLEVSEYAKARPPSYESEYMYIPNFMTCESSAAAIPQVAKEDLQPVRPAGVIYVEPPSYQLVHLHVPEFMVREGPTTVPVREKKSVTLEAAVTVIKHPRPATYEVDFPYVSDLTYRKAHVKALEREKKHSSEVSKKEVSKYNKAQPPSYEIEYMYIPDFMTDEPSESAIPPVVKEGALQAVRPAGVFYVEPPYYQLEYLYVPEFMAKEGPTVVPVSEKEAITEKAAISTIHQTPPLGHEPEFPDTPDISCQPQVKLRMEEKTEETEAFKFEVAQHAVVNAPSYEMEYKYVRHFITHGKLSSAVVQHDLQEKGTLKAVRPAGVVHVEPPSYELEYLYVPKFMTRERLVREKEPVALEAAATDIKDTKPPRHEVEFPYVPNITYGIPHAEALEKKTKPPQVSKPEVAEYAKVQPPSYELEHRYIPDFMTREPSKAATVRVEQESALQAVRPTGVLNVEPPPYELEYLYVQEFLARERPTTVVREKGPVAIEAAVTDIKHTIPTDYEVDFPYVTDLTYRTPHAEALEKMNKPPEVSKPEVAEYAKVQPPSYELEYRYIPDFMTREPSPAALPEVAQEGVLQAVRPAGVLHAQPPPYELEYLYVPEFMKSQEPIAEHVKEKEPVAIQATVIAIKPTIQPGYEVELPYVPAVTYRKPLAQALEREKTKPSEVSTQEVAEYAKVRPSSYESEYMYIPDYMTHELPPAALPDVAQEGVLQALRLAGVLCVQPPPYELEYQYVPEFMAKEEPTAAPAREKEPLVLEAAVMAIKHSIQRYEAELPYVSDLTYRKPHVEALERDKTKPSEVSKQQVAEYAKVHPPRYELEYRYIPDFMTREPSPAAVPEVAQEGVLQAMRPADVLYAQPPPDEQEYLCVPEFMKSEETIAEHVKEKEPVTIEATVMAIKHTIQPSYEVELPYVPALTYRKPLAQALEREKTKPSEVSTQEVAEYAKGRPSSYELEYMYIPDFMTHEPSPAALPDVAQEEVLQAVRPAGVFCAQPPPYELEYQYVPEFMAKEGPTAAPAREKEPLVLEAAVMAMEHTIQPGYEAELPYVADLTYRKPHVEALERDETKLFEVSKQEVADYAKVHIPRYELEYRYIPDFMTREPSPAALPEAAQDGVLQTGRPATVVCAQPPPYELEYHYVPESMAKEEPTAVPVREEEPLAIEAAVTAIRHTIQPGYEVEFPYVPDLTYSKRHVKAHLLQVSKTEVPEYVQVRPPSYESEYIYAPDFMTYESSGAVISTIVKEGAFHAVRPAGVLYVEPPSYELEYLYAKKEDHQAVRPPGVHYVEPPPYELEYLYVPEFLAGDWSTTVGRQREPVTIAGAATVTKHIEPTGYEKEFPCVTDPTYRKRHVQALEKTKPPKLTKMEVAEYAIVEPPSSDLEYKYIHKFMTRELPGASKLSAAQEGAVHAVRPAGVLHVETPPYKLEYLYVPEFMTREEPTTVAEQENGPVATRVAVTVIKHTAPPDHEAKVPYVQDLTYGKPESHEVEKAKPPQVSKPEMAEYASVQPPSYELEYRYIHGFVTRELSEAATIQVAQEGVLQGVEPASVLHVEPPSYEPEYRYVPEFMVRKEPTTVPVQEKEPVAAGATATVIQHTAPPDYEVELPYLPDLTYKKSHVEALEMEKARPPHGSKPEVAEYAKVRPTSYELEYRYIPDFMAREPSSAVIRQVAQEGALPAVRPAGVLYVEPPAYELEYIYVPEFMARQEATALPVREEEPIALEATVTVIKRTTPHGYENELPYIEDLPYGKPHVKALEMEKARHPQVSKPKSVEYVKVQPTSYELEYRYIPDFMTREPSGAAVPQLAQERVLQAVRPAGVLYVEPPLYEVEYLDVPEFMARDEPTDVPLRAKEPIAIKAAVKAKEHTTPPGYEAELPYVEGQAYKEPQVKTLEREKTHHQQVSMTEVPEYAQVRRPSYELEYMYVPEFMTREPSAAAIPPFVKQGALQSVRPAGVLYVEPPLYELEYIYVPDFLATERPTDLPVIEIEPIAIEGDVKVIKHTTPHGYEVEFPCIPEITYRTLNEGLEKKRQPPGVTKAGVVKYVKAQPPIYEMECKYIPDFMTPELSEISMPQVLKEGALQAVRPAGVLYVEPPPYQQEWLYVPEFMTREGPSAVPVEKTGALKAVRPAGVLHVEPPSYELEYLYVPEFMARESPVREKEPLALEAAAPAIKDTRTPGYEVEFLYTPEITYRKPHVEAHEMEKAQHPQVSKTEVVEYAKIQPQNYELEYMYIPDFMTHEPSGAAIPQVAQKQALQTVPPAGVLYPQPPPYQLEYLYVPEFIAKEEPTSVDVKEKEPIAVESTVTVVKRITSPGYEVELPYVQDLTCEKRHAEALEIEKTQHPEVSKPKVAEYTEVQPPSYELEYRYIPNFTTRESSGAATAQVAQEGGLQAVRPAGVVYVEPPPYELEYLYVPEFKAKVEPPAVPLKEKEPVPIEAAVTVINRITPPAYEAQLPYQEDLTYGKPHVEAHVMEKAQHPQVSKPEVAEYAKVLPPSYELKYRYVHDFMTREPSGSATAEVPHEEALQAVRPAGVVYVEPPPYELEYLYVPEFKAKVEPPTFHLKEKEPVPIEATVTVIKRTTPPAYEVELPYEQDLTYGKPYVEAHEMEKAQHPQVSKPEVAEYAKVLPPSYELEYRYVHDFMTREPSGSATAEVPHEEALQAVRPAGVVYVEPPPYELEYLYVPEFKAKVEPPTFHLKEKEPVPIEATVTVIKRTTPPAYEVELPYEQDLTYGKPYVEAHEMEKAQHPQVSKPEVAEYAKVLPPSYELEYRYVHDFMTREPSGSATAEVPHEEALQAVRPAGVVYVEPPPDELEYLYVPEFKAKVEPPAVPLKEKEPVPIEAAVTVIKRITPPAYEAQLPYQEDLTYGKPHVEAHVMEKAQHPQVSKPEVAEYAKVLPPSYELEYRYVHDFMTREPSGSATAEVPHEEALQAVRAAGVVYVEPPPYELEYLYVPEFKAKVEPPTVHLKEKEPVPIEATVTVIKLTTPPAYEVELPYEQDLTYGKPYVEAHEMEKAQHPQVSKPEVAEYAKVLPPSFELKYRYVHDFMTREPSGSATAQVPQEEALQAVRPAGVVYVEPPPYELEYLYVPEFKAKVEPPTVHLKEKEPVPIEAAVTVIKRTTPPAYEVELPYEQDLTYGKPYVEAHEMEKTQPSEVSKPKVAEYTKVQPPSYEWEYRNIPDFMTREPSGSATAQVAQEGALQAVIPAGVVFVEPPPYELEYLYVPEFKTKVEPPTVHLKEKEPVRIEAAVTVMKRTTPPAYEVESPYVQHLTYEKPHVEAHEMEKTQPPKVSKPEVAEYAKVLPPSYELEYRYVPDFMTREPSGSATAQVPQEGALQAVRPAGVVYVEPTPYELEYLYVPEFKAKMEPPSVHLKEKEPVRIEAAVTVMKRTTPPAYEVESPYVQHPTYEKPHVEAHEMEKTQPPEVSKPEVAEYAKVLPPSYELEYRYVPDFMTREPSGSATAQVPQEEALQAVRPAGVVYVEPPPYELEYLYVPEFKAKVEPPTVHLKEKEPVPIEATVTVIKRITPPAYEVELPYEQDLTYGKPHVEVHEIDKAQHPQVSKPEVAGYAKVLPPSYELKYRFIPDFMTQEPSGAATAQVAQEGALQAVRPAGVIYVEPPPYELEYLYVPEFKKKVEPPTVHLKEKEPVRIEAAVTVIKRTTPPAYEVESPYVQHLTYGKPHVEAHEMEKTQPQKVSKPKVAEYTKVQPPSYELEYRFIPDFMTQEPSGAATAQVAQEGALQAVRPAGVIYVEPPPYELEYLNVPEFKTKVEPPTVHLKEKEPVRIEAAVTVMKRTTPPAYEVESPYVQHPTYEKPHVEAHEMEKTQPPEVSKPEVAEYAKLLPPSYELEYINRPDFMAREPSGAATAQVAQQGALQAVRPAGVVYVRASTLRT
ncbi:hypothetical protein MRX96_034092 [Rhipicephalus microplus]